MMSVTPILVFSELDEVLSPNPTDALAAAGQVLCALSRMNVSVILCSSKTRAELELVRHEMALTAPFICENGGALFVPPRYIDCNVARAREVAGYQALEFGRPYTEIVEALRQTSKQTDVEVGGFSGMSVDQVARECGLTLLQARLAKLREYDEPFRVLDPRPAARERLIRGLTASGLHCQRIGCHDRVGDGDRQVAMGALCKLVRRVSGSLTTVCFANPRTRGNLLPLVDLPMPVSDEPDTTSSRIDVLAWSAAITTVVRDLRRATSPALSFSQ